MNKKRQGGFIDPLSLIGLGFLVVTLLVSTVAVNKQRQLINSKADNSYICKMCMEDCLVRLSGPGEDRSRCDNLCETQCNSGGSETGGPAKVSDTPVANNPCTEGYINTTGVCCNNGRMQRIYRLTDCTATNYCNGPSCTAPAVQPPAQTPINESSLTQAETRAEKKVCAAEGGTWSNNQCQYPETAPTQPAKPAPAPATTTQPAEESRFVAQQKAETQYFEAHSEQNITKCSSFGTCYRETYNCEKEFDQLDCRDGFKCGVHCSAPPSIPAQTSAPAPKLPESVTYQPGVLPPQLAAVNPPNDPLSLTQDPMMAATLNQKIQDCLNKDFSQTQCTQAFQEAANTKDTCVAFYLLENPNANLNQTQDRCNQERTNAAMTAVAAYGALNTLPSVANTAGSVWSTAGTTVTSSGLPGLLQTIANLPNAAIVMAQNALAGSSILRTAAAVATLSQFPASIIACQTYGADSPACQYAAMGITAGYFSDVIGSEQALQSSAQQVKTVAQQGLNELSYALSSAKSILNLPNADNPAGWTLGTYGGQTILPSSNLAVTNNALAGTAFADDALLSVVNSQYVSGGGIQKVIIDPIKDPYLAQYLDEAQLFINTQRTSRGVSRVPLAQQFVTETFPGYSGSNVPRDLIEETMAIQQQIYRERGGTAYLGEFINCQAGVCREQSLTLHTVLARAGKESEVVTGYLGSGGKHAWVEFIDSITGQRMVADSVWDFVLPVEEAYQIYGGVSNTTSQVFITP